MIRFFAFLVSLMVVANIGPASAGGNEGRPKQEDTLRHMSISFGLVDATLTEQHKQSLRNFFQKLEAKHKLGRITLLSWYDRPFPRPYDQLVHMDRYITEGRVDHTEEFLRDEVGIPGGLMQTFNMAHSTSFVANVLDAKSEEEVDALFRGPDVRLTRAEYRLIKSKVGPAKTLVVVEVLPSGG